MPLGLVTLPVIGGDVALAHVQAFVVHDEDFGHQALVEIDFTFEKTDEV